MNVAEVISRMRTEVLDDNIEPYLWGNSELINCLNDTVDELAEENLVIKDQSTTAITQIKLLSNQHLYSLDDRIIHVRSARLEDDATQPITITTEDWLDANINDWRNTTGSAPSHIAPSAAKGYLSIYPKFDDEFEFTGDMTFTATDTISQTGGNFSGLAADDEIYISGTTSNNGFFTVVTVGTTSFTVSETVTDESGTDVTIRKVMDTLLMVVNRTVSAPFTVSDIADETEITEIKSLHHSKLLNGMAKRAFLKPDSETYDKGKAEYHRGLFEIDKKRMRRSLILLNKPDKTRTIRSGTGIGY